jgi:hypothetical protein
MRVHRVSHGRAGTGRFASTSNQLSLGHCRLSRTRRIVRVRDMDREFEVGSKEAHTPQPTQTRGKSPCYESVSGYSGGLVRYLGGLL